MEDENKPKGQEEPAKTYSEDEYNALKKQLDDANAAIQSYKDMDIDSIKKSADDWKQKYEAAESERKAKEHSDRIDGFVRGQGMKNSVYAEHLKRLIMDKQLAFDDKGVLVGGNDVVKALRESCPDAFGADPDERAAAPTSGHAPQTMSGVEREFYAMNPTLKK